MLISHSWSYGEQYNRVVDWLDDYPYFKWSDHSISADNPYDSSSDTELKEKITNQISGCNAVIVISGMYASYSKWIDYEVSEAVRFGKPIIGLQPWGNERTPAIVSENATALVGWNSTGLVNAIRDYAL